VIEARYFILPDDHKLCYSVYGDPAGFPILYCHGFPACRLEAKVAHDDAQRVGVRLIAIDRPGYGDSDFLPNRTLLDWSKNVRGLLSYLHVERFSVLGVSGGAPYAMSCAYELHDQVSKLGIVCGLGWLGDKASVNNMRLAFRLFLKFHEHFPQTGNWLAKHLLASLMANFPTTMFRMIKSFAVRSDKNLLSDPVIGSLIRETLTVALQQGSQGPAWEFTLYTKSWGFDLEDINVETYLWHGDNDHTVPLAMSKKHQRLIPHAQLKIFPDEGHFSVPIRHGGEILQTLRD
jgi:pimeloyl-ACP methyl ester carboxylesterase